jgi:glycosyltransferase involved in cell wall biosynthesis
MPGLRIGVNALYLIPGGVGGTEIYLRSLLAALAELDPHNQYLIYTNRETGSDLAPERPNFTVVPSPVRASFRPARILWEQFVLPVQAAQRRLDVLLNPGFTAPLLSACPMVTVFHDLQHKRHPEYFRWFDLPFWKLLLYGSAYRSRLLLADSEATRNDLLRLYRLNETKVRVAPLGVDPVLFELGKQRGDLDPFILTVSTLHPHKNLERLLRAFARFRRQRPEFRLVVAGLRGFHAQPLERLRRELQLESTVEFTGWIPREALYALYRRAAAFIYPSTFEGFGLPLLEAMAAGLPLACSSIEPLASHAGEAALLFDPSDESAMADALLRLTSDDALRRRLASAGPARAAEFSWSKTACLTLKALLEVCRKR